MITIELYNSSAENIVVNKTSYLKLFKTIRGVFRESTSLLAPIIQIVLIESNESRIEYKVKADNYFVKDNNEYDVITFEEITDLISCNYLYIREFNRYYYINNIISIRTNLWELHCGIDTLMTYKEGIKTLEAFVERNQFTYNPRLIDTKRVIEQGNVKELHVINNDFFSKTPNISYVLNGFALNLELPPKEEKRVKVDEKKPATGPYWDWDRDKMETYFSSSYGLNSTNVANLANFMLKPPLDINYIFGGAPQNYLQNLIYFPCELLRTDNEFGTLKIAGVAGTENKLVTACKLSGLELMYDLGEFNVGKHYDKNDFKNYNGYITYKLWLPFYGLCELEANEIAGQVLEFELIIDSKTGQAMYYILASDKEIARDTNFKIESSFENCRIIKNISFQLGIVVPLGGSNAVDIQRNLIAGAVKLVAIGASASVAPAMTTTATMTSSSITTNVSKKPVGRGSSKRLKTTKQDISTFESQSERTYDHRQEFLARKGSEAIETSISSLSNFSGGAQTDIPNNSGLMFEAPKTIIFYAYKPNFIPINDDYAELRGLPLGETKILGTLKGYTEVSEVRIKGDNFSTITNDEKNILNEALLNGFIL